MSDRGPVVEVAGISKRFGGIQALADVSLQLHAGEVHALVGANGAGKSTLKNVIAGGLVPDEGRILVDGEPVVMRKPADGLRLGIHAVHQELGLIPWMSVQDNLYLSRYPTKVPGIVSGRRLRRTARRDLTDFGLSHISPGTRVGSLSVGQQQLVEISRATSSSPRCLLLDEPSAVLVGPELELVLATVERLRDEGVAIVYVSHRLEEVFRLADRVTVLRNGSVVETAPTADFTTDGLIRAMTGRAVVHTRVTPPERRPDTRLRVTGVGAGGRLKDVSLEVRAGEIVGLAGLIGSGRSHLVKAIYGIDPRDEGEVLVDGRRLPPGRPAQALSEGVVLVPEDRKGAGLVIDMSIAQNLTLPHTTAVARRGWIDRGRRRDLATRLAALVGIAKERLAAPVSQLSGGNQQKVALARWLKEDPAVFIVDEPTRGVDVGAKEDIYRLLREVADRGSAVLVVSSEFEELLALCHRVLVMRGGAIVGEADPATSSAEDILRLCSHTPAAAHV
jgi:ABC-type sugar transport system ATPase subunit